MEHISGDKATLDEGNAYLSCQGGVVSFLEEACPLVHLCQGAFPLVAPLVVSCLGVGPSCLKYKKKVYFMFEYLY